jgi:transcriptional regulator with GAF, ATPase, and Fis domain
MNSSEMAVSSETRVSNSLLVRFSKIRVRVTRGAELDQVLERAGGSITIGTAPTCDLVLSDDTVSRVHCELLPTEFGVRVRDAQSTNGVLVAGIRVYDAVFSTAVVIQLGGTLLHVDLLGSAERALSPDNKFGDLLGQSPAMRALFADLERISRSDVSLLIEGETGTGKELVAESVHRSSARSEGPLVVLDCSAITPSLVESEFFGHERGAFTGADRARPGLFEQAHGGTLFLDELGELPKDIQPKLLRVLEKREVRRLGGQRTNPVDVRVIAATNRHLAVEVERGNFREDLYYRIAGARVVVPPLRDRKEDIALLVAHFMRLQGPAGSVAQVNEETWDMFRSHRWPGNVRELRNAVQRWLVMPERTFEPDSTRGPTADATEGFTVEATLPLRIARREAADAFERTYLKRVLRRTEGNVTRAAAVAEVSRQMIQKLLTKHGISRDE